MTPANTTQAGLLPSTTDVIPLCVPEMAGNEWSYVRDCLDTGWVSSVGAYVTRFEAAIARVAGKRFAVAVVNGTSALHIALICAGVERNDAVLVSDLTFIAPANAICYLGAHPVFIDAEPAYWQIDPAAVERFCRRDCTFVDGVLRTRVGGRRVRALLPVSILGHPVDLDPLRALANRYGLALIEDATESLATIYRNGPVGAGADISCFSFNGNKLLTTGGGGMLCTDDAAIAERARYLTTQAKDDPIEYVHGEVGYNYRLTNVQAAIGCAQIECLERYVAAKREHAEYYTELLGDIPGLTLAPQAPYARATYWLYTILVDPETFGLSSRELLAELAAHRIQTRPLWQPLHLSPAHSAATFAGGDVAVSLNARALSLPSSVGLSSKQLETVAATIRALRP